MNKIKHIILSLLVAAAASAEAVQEWGVFTLVDAEFSPPSQRVIVNDCGDGHPVTVTIYFTYPYPGMPKTKVGVGPLYYTPYQKQTLGYYYSATGPTTLGFPCLGRWRCPVTQQGVVTGYIEKTNFFMLNKKVEWAVDLTKWHAPNTPIPPQVAP